MSHTSYDFRNVEKDVEANTNYRNVVYTTEQTQLVLMSLEKNEDIPAEIHSKITQFIRVESGTGKAVIAGKEMPLVAGSSVVIPAETRHYIANTGTSPLKLYTLYSPPEHSPDRVDIRQPTHS
jgi:mannose-6-phosphate isomerase-like protein (cupin superfamily)